MARALSLFTVFSALCCGLLAACAPLWPATAPPQLTHTPGAFVEISAGYFDAGSFQFNYPASWRLIKLDPAEAPNRHIVLLATDGSQLSLRVVDEKNAGDGRFIALATGNFLLATSDTAPEASPIVAAEFRRILQSIRS